MSTPILATKLFIPPPRPTVVPRPRLVKRLQEGLHRKVTLISAPAGFGKTILVSEWLAGRKVAWLSLDEGDSDPTRFLTYFIAALQTVAPKIGEGVLAALQSPQSPPIESILAALLNEITTLPGTFVLVLDDYHLIDAKAVGDALNFFVEHLPPQLHLVIATREDPPLPLARLRARDQLTEVRGADLRFTEAEAATFLQAMGLTLLPEEVAALESRREGWIAGLQLAALSMQGQQDITAFIRAFAGDHRYIVDYLVEEVLQHQPEAVRNFLLQTAILDELNGPLCDAVTGQEQSKARLEALERGNFFVVPLDDKRQWYRYHHLFADVLSAHLRAEQPEQLSTLHRRASVWYEEHGSTAQAIRHALAAEDFERAAGLIELAVPAMSRSRQEVTLLGWLQALPDEVLHSRPVLSVAYAHVLMANDRLQGVEELLQDAERRLGSAVETHGRPDVAAAATTVVDNEELRRLPGMIAIARAGLALARGDVAGSMTYARRALDLAPEDDYLTRGGAAAFMGLASWTSGELETAHQMYAEGMANLQKAGFISDVVGGAIALADIRITQGRLRQAMRIYEQALQLATEQRAEGSQPILRGTADMYVGMSELYREYNDLDTANRLLLRSAEQGEHTGFPQNPYRWRVAMARIKQAEGDAEAALDLLREAEQRYVSDFYPNVQPITAVKTRVWVSQGRLDKALTWAREQGLSAQDDLNYLREFEHITLARVLLARAKSDPAERSIREMMGLLHRLLQAADEGGRMGRVIEILLLHALAFQVQGDIAAALAPLERALMLAEPQGYVRIFVDEGAPMAQLLVKAAARGMTPEYIERLLAALDVEQKPNTSLPPLPTSLTSPASQPLIEPLSQRELEVLRLFKTELPGPEIAQELVVALSTLRTHTKAIYGKLNVNSRQAAVKRATELGLI